MFNSTITLHIPLSLLLRWNAEEMGDPLCFACSRCPLSILLLSLGMQPERIFFFVLSAICTSKHAQCRMRVNDLPPLCNFIRDNRPGYMKGLYATEGSNGKIQILWNIIKFFFKQYFFCLGFLFQHFQACLVNIKLLFLSLFLPFSLRKRHRMKDTPEKYNLQLHICLQIPSQSLPFWMFPKHGISSHWYT